MIPLMQGDDSPRRPAEDAVEELVALVLDHLVPVVGRYRDQLARRLGTSPAGLTVLERARARPTTAARSAAWTGMTPSAMTKVVRRLEEQGHVARVPSADHEQELSVELRPHEERDLVLARIRDEVRWSMRHVVSVFGLTDMAQRGVAANALVHAAATLEREAARMEARAARLVVIARRRKEREERAAARLRSP